MDKKAGIGLGTVIIILIAAVLLFQGIKFSTSTVNNTSNSYNTTEGVFSNWVLKWNTTMDSANLEYFTPAALVTQTGSNSTWRSLTDGSKITFSQVTGAPSGSVFDRTSTINYVYNLYRNSTNVWYVIGQDGTVVKSTTYNLADVSVSKVMISINGQYIAIATLRNIDGTYRLLCYSGV